MKKRDVELLEPGMPEAGVPDRYGCLSCGLVTTMPGGHDCPSPSSALQEAEEFRQAVRDACAPLTKRVERLVTWLNNRLTR